MIVYNVPGIEYEIVTHDNASDRAKEIAGKLRKKLENGGITPTDSTIDVGSPNLAILFITKDKIPIITQGFLFPEDIDKEISNVQEKAVR